MSQSLHKSRRGFLHVSLASLGLTALAHPATARAADPSIVAAAKAALQRLGGRIAHHDVAGVVDFRQPSKLPRLNLVDLASGRIEQLLVAHGRGSDPRHTGWLSRFSNAPGSNATSEGAYVTGAQYVGAHGRSMRLAGLDPTNSNAAARDIVVHAAPYVAPQIAREHGLLGRSEGCFAVSQSDIAQVLARLGPGRLLLATQL